VVVGVGELFRRYEEAKASAGVIRQAAFDKASQAGALQEALATCQASTALATCQATLAELARSCGS
jgi:hypothetical protein